LKRLKRFVVACLAVGMTAVLFPQPASAQLPDLGLLPPEVQQALDDLYAALPPEVQQAIDDAIADALGNLPPPRTEGIGNASATPGNANAAVVNFPGLLTVGKSETSKTGSKVTVLNVGGQDVLTREGNATGGTNGGAAAPVGDLLDQINAATCPGGVPRFSALELFGLGTFTGTCVAVASSKATSPVVGTTTASRTKTAQFALLHVHTDALAGQPVMGLGIGYTDASSFFNQSTTAPRCRDAANSLLVRGIGTAPVALLLFGANPVGSTASSGGFTGVVC